MSTPTSLEELQKQYDAMVILATRSLDLGIDLNLTFEKELTSLMELVKAMGGKV
jgi:hypothetical protein